MKKNNKYRSNNNYNNNNNNNQIFSLNYKFDSISPAGKISGTALDLIKRYNELAKEAQGNADYVEAEAFRQYAEHYRKIVTEINERKNEMNERKFQPQNSAGNAPAAETAPAAEAALAQAPAAEAAAPAAEKAPEAAPQKRSFKIIEINPADAEKPASQTGRSRPRVARKPKAEAAVL